MSARARLFLDAARLGAMSPTAQLAARDFARLAGEGLSTLYWEDFFRGRFAAPRTLPGLAEWRGIRGLKSAVRRMLRAPADAPIAIASRTTALMQSAVQFLAARCHGVLTTDTLWPPYRELLDSAGRASGLMPTIVPVRDPAFSGMLQRDELLQDLVRRYVMSGCRGMFLSSVSHDGVRLPLASIVKAVRAVDPRALIVIDGAQEFAHVPVNLTETPCDLYVAGCHKWLGGYQPLGIGVFANTLTAPSMAEFIRGRLADPLFSFTESLERCGGCQPLETVNLTPLVCANGALADVQHAPQPPRTPFRRQLANVRRLASAAPGYGWVPRLPASGLESGILTLQSINAKVRGMGAAELQQRLFTAGLTVTVYEEGILRVAVPQRKLSGEEWGTLQRGLRSVNRSGVPAAVTASDRRSEPAESAPTTADGEWW